MIDMRRKYGLFTEKQYLVLKLRLSGKTQEEVAKLLNTSRENISIIERRAKENLRLAQRTLKAYKELLSAGEITVSEGTRLVDIPSLVVREADKLGVKLKANFTRLYDEIRYKARNCISGTKLAKPVKIVIFKDGTFEVYPA